MNAHKRTFLIALLFGILLVGTSFAQSVAAAPAACTGAPAPRLAAGMQARPAQVYSSLRAGLDSNTVILTMYREFGDTMKVLSGPRCASGPFNWYEVEFAGIRGWVTEGTGTSYWLEPVSASATPIPSTSTPIPSTPVPTATKPPMTATPVPTATPPVVSPGGCEGAPAPRLRIGDTGTVEQVYSSLRQAIHSNTILATLYRSKNDRFKVINGPFCAGTPYNWWEIEFNGVRGFATEGTGSTYWLAPLTR